YLLAKSGGRRSVSLLHCRALFACCGAVTRLNRLKSQRRSISPYTYASESCHIGCATPLVRVVSKNGNTLRSRGLRIHVSRYAQNRPKLIRYLRGNSCKWHS